MQHNDRLSAWPPLNAKVRMYLVYLQFWTLNLRPLMVYPKVLFPPKFGIKDGLRLMLVCRNSHATLDTTCTCCCSGVNGSLQAQQRVSSFIKRSILQRFTFCSTALWSMAVLTVFSFIT